MLCKEKAARGNVLTSVVKGLAVGARLARRDAQLCSSFFCDLRRLAFLWLSISAH